MVFKAKNNKFGLKELEASYSFFELQNKLIQPLKISKMKTKTKREREHLGHWVMKQWDIQEAETPLSNRKLAPSWSSIAKTHPPPYYPLTLEESARSSKWRSFVYERVEKNNNLIIISRVLSWALPLFSLWNTQRKRERQCRRLAWTVRNTVNGRVLYYYCNSYSYRERV